MVGLEIRKTLEPSEASTKALLPPPTFWIMCPTMPTLAPARVTLRLVLVAGVDGVCPAIVPEKRTGRAADDSVPRIVQRVS